MTSDTLSKAPCGLGQKYWSLDCKLNMVLSSSQAPAQDQRNSPTQCNLSLVEIGDTRTWSLSAEMGNGPHLI